MVDLDVIEPADESIDWVDGLVVVVKPKGKLRIFLDSRPLYQTMKRKIIHLPTAEEFFSQMSGAKYFSKLNASSGYWQIKVDRRSSNLLTFGTSIGRFRFKRLPYGIHSTTVVFQKISSSIISDIQGSANSQDGIVIWEKKTLQSMTIASEKSCTKLDKVV